MSYPDSESGVGDLGLRHFVRPCVSDDGRRYWLWWHDCPTVEHVSWGWIGDQGDKASGHVITTVDPLTVVGSLLCPDCGDHGFIRAGRWCPA